MKREMALMGKTRLERDLADRHLALTEQNLGAFDATSDHILMYRKPRRFAEERFKVRDAQSGAGRDLVERDVAAEIVFDKGEGLFQSASRETTILFLRLWCDRAMSSDETRGDRDGQAFEI